MKFLLGRKLGMTTLQDALQGALNVTLIECEPNTVSLLRTPAKDGYAAVQIEAKVRKLREALEPQAAMISDIPQFDLALGYELYSMLLKPVVAGKPK